MTIDRPSLETYATNPGPPLPDRKVYELNANFIKTNIADGIFMKGARERLQGLAEKYTPNQPELLLSSKIDDVDLHVKPYVSVVNKIYRINVVENQKFPSAPPDGWVDDSNFFVKINDIIRTRIVCKYIDGPELVCKELGDLCKALGLKYRYYPMNTDRGYYSWHFYAAHPVEIINKGGVLGIDIDFEIQITTQLAEVLTALTHILYEGDRVKSKQDRDSTWKWQPETPRFRSTFMGHTLHLLEGVILSLKDDVMPSDKKAASTESKT